jgi:ribosomal protein L7/L12
LEAAARHLLTQKAMVRAQTGASLDDVIASLRDQGANKIDCIAVIRCVYGLGLQEAKRAVHFSPAWSDVKQRDSVSGTNLKTA